MNIISAITVFITPNKNKIKSKLASAIVISRKTTILIKGGVFKPPNFACYALGKPML